MTHCAVCNAIPVPTDGDLCTRCEDDRDEDEQTYRRLRSFLRSIYIPPSRAIAIALCLAGYALASALRGVS